MVALAIWKSEHETTDRRSLIQPDDALRQILEALREQILKYAGDDPDKRWYANRFVFARLQLDERRTKTSVKQKLLADCAPCHGCRNSFKSRSDIHLHRLDSGKAYSDTNCVLMHAECHRQAHAADQEAECRPAGARGRAVSSVKVSKRYEGLPFTYWWDVSPSLAEKLDEMEALEFVQKDTRERCIVPVETLRGYLSLDRQTTRGTGNWGVKVLRDHPDELAFEPGAGASGEWRFLPIVWLADAED